MERLRQRFVEEGLEAALTERPRPGARPKLDGSGEAHLVALACTTPPDGRERWTMQLLADRLVELGRRARSRTRRCGGSLKNTI